MSHLAYFRVSTSDQSTEAQRHALLKAAGPEGFAREFHDEGVSGAIPAAQRPGFAALLAYAREGDTLHVYAVDRLGRDAIDVQTTVRALIEKGVAVEVHGGVGRIARGVGEVILAVLAQVADMERHRIREHTEAGRVVARESLALTGKTHKGKASMGRPKGHAADGVVVEPAKVAEWRKANGASIATTAQHFGISDSTVKRYCA
jgi:putative DNA-invertase from lambdoid prophage Rac